MYKVRDIEQLVLKAYPCHKRLDVAVGTWTRPPYSSVVSKGVMWLELWILFLIIKAIQNCKISIKALSKWLQKLTIIMKQLIAIVIVSFVNVKD